MDRFIGLASLIVVLLEPFLVGIWVAVGIGRQRRPHFWGRALLGALALPALMAALAGIASQRVVSLPDDAAGKDLLTLMFFCGVVALMFVPRLLYKRSDPSPGPPESDGGGGSGPERSPLSPDGPRGGIPLPDADQARTRVRDHDSSGLGRRRRRRPARVARRAPTAPNR